MNFPLLLEKITKRLIENGNHNFVKQLSYAANESEVFSFLRENLFKSDSKTHDFIISVKLEGASEQKKRIERESLSEAEFTKLIYQALSSHLEKKGSKFKVASHWYSQDEDLCVNLADKNGLETQYKVMSIKAD